LGMPEPKRSRISALGVYSPHAQKALSDSIMISDGL
jgi:hypothetical protein